MFSREVGCTQVQTGLPHLLKLIPRNIVGGIEGCLQEMKQVSLTSVCLNLLLWPLQ